ncbi:MAG: glycosyltransferase family 4 protein [Candidatus Moranbacteria bacterium]|nr:glycosyltransferase family 4 protein [Candidatus Moranbacteria bacterium]
MNIAIFTNNYLPNPYGVSKSVESFRKELEKRGHSVFIFAPLWKEFDDKNPNVFRYPSIDTEFRFRFPLAVPHSIEMDKIIKKLNLDIIHSQHPNLLGFSASRWAKKKKIPLVFTWHTLYDQYAAFVPFLPKKLVMEYMTRKAVSYANKADRVVVPTDSIIPILKGWGVRKEMKPIATGVDEEQFRNPDRKKIRQKYNIADDEAVLLLVSRLTPEKNVEFVFNSVFPVLKKNNRTRFLVAGDGYLADSLKDLCRKNGVEGRVIFAGLVGENDMKDYYAASDIFVYGSKSETQGMIITEAMYSGLPIVAVSATGVSSLVEDGANGFLVKENEEEFSKAVLKLAEDDLLRQRFSDASARIAREEYTASVSTGKLLEMYEQAIKAHDIG